MPTCADILARTLRDAGITRMFGLPGGEILDFMDAARHAGIEFLLTRHEAAASFMADVTGQISRRPGVCVATLGPGHWFGEMSVLDVQVRSASVRALSPCRLLVLTARDLDALYRRDLKSYTLLVLNVARELSRRLRLVDDLVADFIGSVRNQHIGYG